MATTTTRREKTLLVKIKNTSLLIQYLQFEVLNHFPHLNGIDGLVDFQLFNAIIAKRRSF